MLLLLLFVLCFPFFLFFCSRFVCFNVMRKSFEALNDFCKFHLFFLFFFLSFFKSFLLRFALAFILRVSLFYFYFGSVRFVCLFFVQFSFTFTYHRPMRLFFYEKVHVVFNARNTHKYYVYKYGLFAKPKNLKRNLNFCSPNRPQEFNSQKNK